MEPSQRLRAHSPTPQSTNRKRAPEPATCKVLNSHELFARIEINVRNKCNAHIKLMSEQNSYRTVRRNPAYDICPQSRAGQQASQAMLVYGAHRSSQVATCVAAAPSFLLGREETIGIVNHQVNVIEREWLAICNEASMSTVDQTLFWQRQFLNPFAFLDAPEGVRSPDLALDM